MKAYTLEGSSTTLRYHDLPGVGTPIIFIHGLGCASSFDYPQVAAMNSLAQHRRILVDLIGSGFSDKPTQFNYSIDAHADYLETFIHHLDMDEFFIYGHSMGGTISVVLASRFETKLKGLILSEANLDSGGGLFSKQIASYSEHDYLKYAHNEIIQENKMETNNNWATTLSMSTPVAIYKESVSLIAEQNLAWRNVFYALKTDKTFIFGQHSLPDPEVHELEQAGINIEIVADAGHSMAWDNPEGLAEAIRKGMSPLNSQYKT